MDNKNDGVIAAEIKISITTNNLEEVQELIRKIRQICQSSYKLNVNVEGDFVKS